MPDALYNRDILRLAASVPHLEPLANPLASVEKRSALCGSRIRVEVVTDREGKVIEFGMEVSACALGQASAALMASHAIGRNAAELAAARDSLENFLKKRRGDPGTWPGLQLFALAREHPGRHGSILLAFEAAAEAVAQSSLRAQAPSTESAPT